ALLAAPSRSLLLAFTGVFVFVLAFACWVPPAVMMGSRLAAPPMGRAFGVLGAMAARGLAASLSRTGVATGALVIAVATTLGVGVMVDSFRATLVDWLDVTLQADVYVTSARPSSRGSAPALEPEVVGAMKTASGVSFASTYRRTEVSSPVGPTQLHALSLDRRGFDAFQLERGDPDDLYRRFRDGDGVMVSEPYAYRHDLRRGDTVTLGADSGSQGFEVLGVFYDYASDRGLVMIDRALYDRHWRDDGVHSLGLFLEPGEDFDARVAELRASVDPSEVAVMPNRELRRISLDIFDRTFVITGVLRLLAIGVAFVGVLSALLALQLERARELGVLRATGLTPAQVWGLVTAQTGLLGLISGLLSTPLGLALAALLIHVINKRSFGWTLSMQVSPWLVVQAVVLALVAALLAGLYPSWRMSRSSPAWALREE
ncbi:MAG: ABC transporter permease, partial [Acidobacteriota bacterium]